MNRLPESFIIYCSKFKKSGSGKNKKGFDLLLDRNIILKYDECTKEKNHPYANVDKLVYIKRKKKSIGIVIIHKGYCGWSLCHYRDKWDKNIGIYKAICKLGSKKSLDGVYEEIKNRLYYMKVNRNEDSGFQKELELFAELTFIKISKLKGKKKNE